MSTSPAKLPLALWDPTPAAAGSWHCPAAGMPMPSQALLLRLIVSSRPHGCSSQWMSRLRTCLEELGPGASAVGGPDSHRGEHEAAGQQGQWVLRGCRVPGSSEGCSALSKRLCSPHSKEPAGRFFRG